MAEEQDVDKFYEIIDYHSMRAQKSFQIFTFVFKEPQASILMT